MDIGPLRTFGKIIVSIAMISGVILLFVAFFVGRCSAANLPHYADLTFTDQADLDARVDSVLTVCDSAMTQAQVDSLVRDGWDVYNPVICRQWAGLTIYDNAGMQPGYYQVGHARLWWWEKED